MVVDEVTVIDFFSSSLPLPAACSSEGSLWTLEGPPAVGIREGGTRDVGYPAT